jgi:hypothetical protein
MLCLLAGGWHKVVYKCPSSSYIHKTAQTSKRFSTLTCTCNSLLWVYQTVRFFLCGEFSTYSSKVFSEFLRKKCRQVSRKKLWNRQKNSRILLLDQNELNPFVANHHFVWYGEQPTNMCWLLVAGMIWFAKNAHFEESEETLLWLM